MLINKVILSSDDHPNYIYFWPIVYKAWKKIGIEPILVYIGNNMHLLDYQDNIIQFNSEHAFLKTAYIAQCIRLLIPAMFKDDIVIIADIDNIPLKKTYFFDNIQNYDDNIFIHYRGGAAGDQQIAIPWNVAKGSTWAEIFNLCITDNMDMLQQIDQKLVDWYPSNYMSINEGLSQSWFTDQILLKTYIDKWPEAQSRYVELNDIHTGFYRLDRGTNDTYHSTVFDVNQIHRYTDFSPPRPYLKHKNIIDQILHYYSL